MKKCERIALIIASLIGVLFFGCVAVVFGDESGASVLATITFGAIGIYNVIKLNKC